MIISTPEKFIQPILQFDDTSGLYRQVEDYCFQYGWRDHSVRRIIIPKGEEYDGASVPDLVPPVIARRDGPWLGGSAFHDYIWKHCQHGGTFPPGTYQIKVGDQWVDLPKMSQWDSNILLALMARATKRVSWAQSEVYRWAVQLWPPNWFKGF